MEDFTDLKDLARCVHLAFLTHARRTRCHCAAVSDKRSRGRGGQGWTATAVDKATGETKVIKSVACDNIKAGNVALQEAKVLQSLDHPAVVKYQDVFLHKEKSRQELLVCTVMDYCEHGDLAKRF